MKTNHQNLYLNENLILPLLPSDLQRFWSRSEKRFFIFCFRWCKVPRSSGQTPYRQQKRRIDDTIVFSYSSFYRIIRTHPVYWQVISWPEWLARNLFSASAVHTCWVDSGLSAVASALQVLQTLSSLFFFEQAMTITRRHIKYAMRCDTVFFIIFLINMFLKNK